MPSVFLDYETVSRGDLDPAPLREVLPDLRLYDSSDAAKILMRCADAEVVCVNKAVIGRAQGVGPKLATRLVTELKDKAPAVALQRHAQTGEPIVRTRVKREWCVS